MTADRLGSVLGSRAFGHRLSLVAVSAIALCLGTAGVLVSCGGSSSGSHSAGVRGPSEVKAEAVSTSGANPFTAAVGKDTPGVMPPAAAVSASRGPASYSGGLPGLYGGTRNLATCDANKLVAFLEQNRAKAVAWAATLGIQPAQIRDYVSGLTAVILRTDTRVTNHGYVEGHADPIQSLLQAGTAVFVDKYGRPVVKCYCGNPLTPPELYTTPIYVGPLWSGFNPTHITIINQSTTIINTFTLWDPSNGMTFTRTPGVNGTDEPYIPSSSTNTTTPPSQTTPVPTTSVTTGTNQTTQPSIPTKAENPAVSLSPSPVTQGETVTLTASGFAPGASLQITVTRPDGVVEHFPTSAGGDGTASYTFPNAAGNAPLGTYNVTVTNPATSAHAAGSIEVLPRSAGASSTGSTGSG
jgi:hypothetical protein